MQPQSLSKQVDLIDVQGWDFHHTTGVLLIRGHDTAIIETGHHRCGEQILTALQERAVPIAASIPEVTVVGHKYAIGALHDPHRLNEGARQLFGSFAQDIQPLPPDIPTQEVQDGSRFDLGRGVELEVIGTPGHTSDHVAYYEQETRTMYTGDATGLLGPEHFTVTPTSFPPSFKFDLYKASIEKLRTYDPAFLVFSHFGAVTESDIPIIFDRALATLDSWKETVEQAWQNQPSQTAVMEVIQQRFADELEVFPPASRPLFIKVMAQGLTQSLLPKSA
jgi:glyoxylase-like metal-dependent hydrolase (beta-lactamase superfamily II)